ncbi:MAG: hypothetical protein ACOYOF_05925 [Verrucomicrobiaceae bacterium]
MWVLLNQRGTFGTVVKFKAYRVPVEILPFVISYAGYKLELNVTGTNVRGATTLSGSVTDKDGLTSDLVRTFIPADGLLDMESVYKNLDYRLDAKTEGYQVPRLAWRKTDEIEIKNLGEGFRKAWLASELNMPGNLYYSGPEKPAAVLVSPLFLVESYNNNPIGIANGIPVIYARWCTPDELDGIADMKVTVGE